MAPQRYGIGDAIYGAAAHHRSFEQLWETKWKAPAQMGVYPFMFGTIQDFEPIVQEITRKGLKEPYDWDEYASMFFPKAEALFVTAVEAEKHAERDKAAEYYLRSSAVYRIARFPAPRSPKQREAWQKGKEAFYKGQSLLPHPIREVLIPHVHKHADEGDIIPVNYLLPPSTSNGTPVPLVLIITGLDGYRTELAVWQEGFRRKGIATLVVEIPGTGDSPAANNDGTSPDRQWSSVLDWLDQQPQIDNKRVVVWGFSTGGYYSLRLAHTHRHRILGSISLGGGAHHMFDADWLRQVNKLEYPFDLTNTLAYKFGYTDADDSGGNGLEAFIAEAPSKFSLLLDGTLDKPCARTLLVNGFDDEIFPIDDMFVTLERGSPKEARIVKGKKHMGEPESFFIILKWIYDLLGIGGNVIDQFKLLPFKAKH